MYSMRNHRFVNECENVKNVSSNELAAAETLGDKSVICKFLISLETTVVVSNPIGRASNLAATTHHSSIFTPGKVEN